MELKINNLKVDAGGPGSRGGKILGYTSSGKPIYEDHRHPSHKKFTYDDHSQAAYLKANLAASLDRRKKSEKERKGDLEYSAGQHRHLAQGARYDRV